jgi:NAD(P)-dependent dehydrogenase (short-subunit alcohol dehydrogenase family)
MVCREDSFSRFSMYEQSSTSALASHRKQKIEEGTSIDTKEKSSLAEWGAEEIPPQTGKQVVVTGATGGLGYEIALGLARRCADVVLAGRNEPRGRDAAAKIRTLAPKALVRFEKLDLADLASVAAFARRIGAVGRPLDLLVNNAGVMALPTRRVTEDGFEMQLGTNYLGHFALTGLLLPLLRACRNPRVVQVSSLAHRFGQISFDNLHGEQHYHPWAAYSQSKLATLMFARELQRRSNTRGWRLQSFAVHPGLAQTNLFANGPGARSLLTFLQRSIGRAVSQSAVDGAKPALFAAVSPTAQPGGFYGPDGLFELAGRPAHAHVASRARDVDVARRLWEVSEELTGIRWPAE